MKSSYELAMERLSKTSPATKLTAAQKEQIAEMESRYKAKIAEREIALAGEINSAPSEDQERIAELKQQLANERKKLQAELEDKKAAIRSTR